MNDIDKRIEEIDKYIHKELEKRGIKAISELDMHRIRLECALALKRQVEELKKDK